MIAGLLAAWHGGLRMKTLLAFFAVAASLITASLAQAPGVPIERNGNRKQDGPLLSKGNKLLEAGKLQLSIEAIKEQIKSPKPGLVEFPPPNTQPLPARDVARIAREGHVMVGWYYLCTRCDHWHLNLAGGYAVAKDAVATCYHCVQPADDMRKGFLIAVDSAGEMMPVIAVLAASERADGVLLRVEGGKLAPLPMNDSIFPGDAAYCYSSPLGQSGYFSDGIVNRFYTHGGTGKGKNLRLNVSTDWAPGSSGAAVLDQAGNSIGHVAAIEPLREGPTDPPPANDSKGEKKRPQKPDRFGGATLITLHDATPARSMLELAKPLRDFKPGDVVATEQSNDGITAAFKESVAKSDSAAANAAARKIAETEDVDSLILNDVAWTLLTSKAVEKPDINIAEKLARRSVDGATSLTKAGVTDTLARALFRLGKKDAAIETQEQAIGATADEQMKSRLKKTLEAYRRGELPNAD